MVVILIIATIVSALLGEFKDAAVVLAVVVLNALLGFRQEYQAEKAMAALKKMAVPIVKVRRGGHVREISSRELVPGDIVLLEAGNLVPADCRLLESANLRTQEAPDGRIGAGIQERGSAAGNRCLWQNDITWSYGHCGDLRARWRLWSLRQACAPSWVKSPISCRALRRSPPPGALGQARQANCLGGAGLVVLVLCWVCCAAKICAYCSSPASGLAVAAVPKGCRLSPSAGAWRPAHAAP
jgi:hypothetical protein